MVALARRVATTAATRYTSSCGRRQLASTLTDTARTTTPVAIVGAGPVGLTLALLLSKFGVRSTVVERLPAPSVHPQAHFINVRSMEVFRSIVNHEGHSVADAITSLARPRAEWSRFLYNAGPLLHGTSLGSTNHFPPETLLSIREQSPELPTHLPQHQLVPILLEALTQRPQSHAPCDIHWGAECTGITPQCRGGATLTISGGQQLHAQQVICCDGANSPTRTALGIGLKALHPMEQQMINVHFTSAALAAALRERNAQAMLYFVYAPDVIGVIVAHNLGTGEFALQLPSFGPHLDPKELAARFTDQHCAKLVRLATIGSSRNYNTPTLSDIEVRSVAGWTMRAAVAQRWVAGNVLLCGDAAHVFPPAGGFGMNTGIQDAHALAWRLAVLHAGEHQDWRHHESTKDASRLLAGYESERRQIAEANSALSIRNYYGVAELSAELGCNPANAELAASVASTLLPPQIFGSSFARGLVESTVALAAQGVLSEQSLKSPLAFGPSRVAAAAARIESGSTLRLHFPAEDLGFCYRQHSANSRTSVDGVAAGHRQGGGEYSPQTAEGARLPLFRVVQCSNGNNGDGSRIDGDPTTEQNYWSVDAIGHPAGRPKMTLFVQRGHSDSERWRTAAIAVGGDSVRVHGVEPKVWKQLQELNPRCNELHALLVRPDGHIWRRFPRPDSCGVDDIEGADGSTEEDLLAAAVKLALGCKASDGLMHGENAST